MSHMSWMHRMMMTAPRMMMMTMMAMMTEDGGVLSDDNSHTDEAEVSEPRGNCCNWLDASTHVIRDCCGCSLYIYFIHFTCDTVGRLLHLLHRFFPKFIPHLFPTLSCAHFPLVSRRRVPWAIVELEPESESEADSDSDSDSES